ncbi:G-protein-signaling modulator 2-like [Acropora muricata]|uniref:G-protein-signaling modulator 2-like n=1 Tax=Acropora muricata TaxID=159855 RepID=UPI0034E61799
MYTTEYYEKHLKIAFEISDRRGELEGAAYGNFGNCYQCLVDYRKSIENQKKDLKVAKEIGHRGGEGAAYGNLGNSYQSLGDYRKSIEYHEKHLKIAKEIGEQGREGRANGNLGNS